MTSPRRTRSTARAGRAATSARRSLAPRDIAPTPFTPALASLVRAVPGALGAAFVDADGEAVDYAGCVDPFDVKVAAAHARILMHHLTAYGALGEPHWLTVRGTLRTVHARALPEGYALVVLLNRRAGFVSAPRSYDLCERRLREEGALGPPLAPPSSVPAVVRTDSRGRPRALEDGAGSVRTVEVIGRIGGLPPGSRGYRVRAQDGAELTLVRESRIAWFVEHDR